MKNDYQVPSETYKTYNLTLVYREIYKTPICTREEELHIIKFPHYSSSVSPQTQKSIMFIRKMGNLFLV